MANHTVLVRNVPGVADIDVLFVDYALDAPRSLRRHASDNTVSAEHKR